jgi:hypothetical protein
MGNMKNCLTCKYQPDWSAWIGCEFRRCVGECKYDVIGKTQFLIPECHHLQLYSITMYDDQSGLPSNCPTWESE